MTAPRSILRAMRQFILALPLALFLAAGPSAAARAQDALDVLPDEIEAGAGKMTACFMSGELSALEARIDATRLPLSVCDQGMIPPQREIDIGPTYLPGNGSVFDCASIRRSHENTRILYGFLRDVVAAAEGPSPICAAEMIHAWAKADALADVPTKGPKGPSRLLGMFVLGGLSSAYLIHPEVRAAAGPDGDKVILEWFSRRSAQVVQELDERLESGRASNVLYWQGFAILPTALMSADPNLLRRSRAAFRIALQEVTWNQPDPADDGFLPAELRRGDKAMTYQVFATLPIVGMATLSKAYGCNFLEGPKRRDQFVDLLARSIQGSFDPRSFAEAAVRFGAAPSRIGQQRTRTVRQAPDLLYLADRLDPRLADRIDAQLAQTLGRPQPVIAPVEGAQNVNNRLGGSYVRLADQAAAMAAEPAPPRLRKLCGG